MSQHGCPERLSNRSKGFQEDGSQPTMEVLVETLTGTAFEMTVSPSDTIFAIKSKICRVEGIPVSQQHLVYNLRELDDSMPLLALGISDGARLRLVLGMRGGPISSRRLPPPPEPWRDIERLLDSNRDDGDWGCAGGGGGGSGCRVTVVVFREGERVNMLRVKENADGSYSPADPPAHATFTDSPPPSREPELAVGGVGGSVGGALQQNAVTMGKMLELRRRMESLNIRRQTHVDKVDIQKTRSEESLSSYSLDAPLCSYRCGGGSVGGGAGGAGYTLLPRARSERSVHEAHHQDRLKLPDSLEALAGSILVSGREEDCAAILEEHDNDLAANIPIGEYGPLVGGEAGGWRRGFGSSSQLAPHQAPPPPPAHARSASSLHVCGSAGGSAAAGGAGLPLVELGGGGGGAGTLPSYPPLCRALLSSSTSSLETLRRHRLLPALARHENTDQLHREVGSERRQRRIEKIAELEKQARVFRFGERGRARGAHRGAPPDHPAPAPAPPVDHPDHPDAPPDPPAADNRGDGVKKSRVRCSWCRKKLSIATVHTCRCGRQYCAPHRYQEVHGCAYDYKAPPAAPPPPALAAHHRLPRI